MPQQVSLAAKSLFVLGLIAGIIAFIALGILAYPGLHADADLFAPVSLNVGSGRGWITTGYLPLSMARVIAERYRYDGHGFVMPLLLGRLMGGSTAERLHGAMGIINAAIFSLHAAIDLVLTSRRALVAVVTALLVGLCAGVIGIALQGRPEQLALLVAPSLLWIRQAQRRGRPALVVSTVSIALMAGISPLLGFYQWLARTVLLALLPGQTAQAFWGRLLTISSAALALLALAIQLCTPFSFAVLIRRILGYGQNPFLQGYQLLLIGNLQTEALFWQLPLLAALAVAAALCIQRRRLLIAGLLAIPFLLLARLSGSYLYLPFVPTCWLFLEQWTAGLRLGLRRLWRGCLLAFLGIYLLLFLRTMVLEVSYLQAEHRFADVKQWVQSVQRQARRENLAVGYATSRTPSLAIFALPGEELISVRTFDHDFLRAHYERTHPRRLGYVFVVQEGHSGVVPPASRDGGRFRLLEDRWTRERARLGWLRLGGSAPGYHLALYRRVA
ncbi:MAG: hypothetical protein VKK62_01775 [Synechococcaceae cyanobacterium]|nr:hypothetical protein [Synechococcaceae cyanobacterium]